MSNHEVRRALLQVLHLAKKYPVVCRLFVDQNYFQADYKMHFNRFWCVGDSLWFYPNFQQAQIAQLTKSRAPKIEIRVQNSSLLLKSFWYGFSLVHAVRYFIVPHLGQNYFSWDCGTTKCRTFDGPYLVRVSSVTGHFHYKISYCTFPV